MDMDQSTVHPQQSADHAHEQQAIDDAYAALMAMAARAEAALESAKRDAKLTDAIDSAAIQAVLHSRVNAFADSKAPLTFGRIDEPDATFYIGRRHVEDAHGEPLVIDWRAGVSAPFYRATWADPLGLDRRRRFALDGRSLVGFFDEHFDDPESEGGTGGVPDPLLAELDRARTGAMRDIVSTIRSYSASANRVSSPLDSAESSVRVYCSSAPLNSPIWIMSALIPSLSNRPFMNIG